MKGVRSVPAPDFPCTIDDAVAYLESVRDARPSALVSRIALSDHRPEYVAVADAVRERQPLRGALTELAAELFPSMSERAAQNIVSGARRAGYVHNRGGRARPAWYASDRGEP